jgi:hypothetical protein
VVLQKGGTGNVMIGFLRTLASAALDRLAVVVAVLALGLIITLPALHSAGFDACNDAACCDSHTNQHTCSHHLHTAGSCQHLSTLCDTCDGHDVEPGAATPFEPEPSRHDPNNCPVCKLMLVMQATVVRLQALAFLFKAEPALLSRPPTVEFVQSPGVVLTFDARGPPAA